MSKRAAQDNYDIIDDYFSVLHAVSVLENSE